ncbi:hypothetical protein J2802_004688 [Paraburkholderia caribensis]|nr:hypothetical protein [Paraburkholderia caribensis]
MFRSRRQSRNNHGTIETISKNGPPIYLRTADGSEYEISLDGTLSGTLRSARSVSISDAHYIADYSINRFLNTVSHVVRFLNDGTLCYSTDLAGTILDCNFKNLQGTISHGRLVAGCGETHSELLFRQSDQEGNTSSKEK